MYERLWDQRYCKMLRFTSSQCCQAGWGLGPWWLAFPNTKIGDICTDRFKSVINAPSPVWPWDMDPEHRVFDLQWGSDFTYGPKLKMHASQNLPFVKGCFLVFIIDGWKHKKTKHTSPYYMISNYYLNPFQIYINTTSAGFLTHQVIIFSPKCLCILRFWTLVNLDCSEFL